MNIYFQLSVQRDLLRFAQVFSQMIHVSVPLRIQNVSSDVENAMVTSCAGYYAILISQVHSVLMLCAFSFK